jgi:hypothetical protein
MGVVYEAGVGGIWRPGGGRASVWGVGQRASGGLVRESYRWGV